MLYLQGLNEDLFSVLAGLTAVWQLLETNVSSDRVKRLDEHKSAHDKYEHTDDVIPFLEILINSLHRLTQWDKHWLSHFQFS